MGANLACCFEVSSFHRSRAIQVTSGERTAPLDNLNPVEESYTTPDLVLAFQFQTWAA